MAPNQRSAVVDLTEETDSDAESSQKNANARRNDQAKASGAKFTGKQNSSSKAASQDRPSRPSVSGTSTISAGNKNPNSTASDAAPAHRATSANVAQRPSVSLAQASASKPIKARPSTGQTTGNGPSKTSSTDNGRMSSLVPSTQRPKSMAPVDLSDDDDEPELADADSFISPRHQSSAIVSGKGAAGAKVPTESSLKRPRASDEPKTLHDLDSKQRKLDDPNSTQRRSVPAKDAPLRLGQQSTSKKQSTVSRLASSPIRRQQKSEVIDLTENPAEATPRRNIPVTAAKSSVRSLSKNKEAPKPLKDAATSSFSAERSAMQSKEQSRGANATPPARGPLPGDSRLAPSSQLNKDARKTASVEPSVELTFPQTVDRNAGPGTPSAEKIARSRVSTNSSAQVNDQVQSVETTASSKNEHFAQASDTAFEGPQHRLNPPVLDSATPLRTARDSKAKSTGSPLPESNRMETPKRPQKINSSTTAEVTNEEGHAAYASPNSNAADEERSMLQLVGPPSTDLDDGIGTKHSGSVDNATQQNNGEQAVALKRAVAEQAALDAQLNGERENRILARTEDDIQEHDPVACLSKPQITMDTPATNDRVRMSTEVRMTPAPTPRNPSGSETSFSAAVESRSESQATAAPLATLPLSNQIELALGRYLEERRSDNEYWTGARLKRARIATERRRRDIPERTHDGAAYSFASYKPIQVKAPMPQKPHEAAAVGAYTIEKILSGTSKGPKQAFKAPVTRFLTADRQPPYSYYVDLQQNVIAPNVVSMHCNPYFGDEFDLSHAEGLKQLFYSDIEGRGQRIKSLLQAQSYECYVESVLHEFELNWADVLRYMLEPMPDVGDDHAARKALRSRDDFLDEDFKRDTNRAAIVLSSLPESTPTKLARAAALCENFKKMTHCSLWHIARRYQFDLVPADREEKAGDVLDQLTCRVCLRLDCPYHGEFSNEGDDDVQDDSSTQSTTNNPIALDIVHPLDVNTRWRVEFPPLEKPIEKKSLPNLSKRREVSYWNPPEFKNKPDDRGPFYSCDHPGSSCKTAKCSCFENGVMCEKSCTCPLDCKRKFQGCSCSEKRRRGCTHICWEDERCACFQFGRECDPELCGGCGVEDLVDPTNRHLKPKELGDKCNNASMQYAKPKHTLLGDSGIHGFGLYAGEPIKKHDFVGEYKGEVIAMEEADRRGAVYEHQKLSYLFTLNETQEIDSTYFGNKVRFINHANSAGANVYPRVMMVNSVHRIALYADRNIRVGEELFFDYGPEFPEDQLGGNKKAKKSAPHVRNANMVRNDFFEVEVGEDQHGNMIARKAAKRGRAIKKPENARKSTGPVKQRGGARAGAGRKRRSAIGSAVVNGADEHEEDEREVASAGQRLQDYNISDDLPGDAVGVDAVSGADEDDVFEPGASDEMGPESSGDDSDSDIEVEREAVTDHARGRRTRGKLAVGAW